MLKWIVLAVGVILVANGFFTRTFSFPNQTPVEHCFYMDYIGIRGCFYNATAPMLIAWVPFVIGAGLIAWSLVRALRKQV